MQTLLLFLIRTYQRYISPDHSIWARYSRRVPYCRFTPTCSAYAYDSITRFGAFRGGVLAIYRVFRCHPWSKGGYDPVPNTISFPYIRGNKS